MRLPEGATSAPVGGKKSSGYDSDISVLGGHPAPPVYTGLPGILIFISCPLIATCTPTAVHLTSSIWLTDLCWVEDVLPTTSCTIPVALQDCELLFVLHLRILLTKSCSRCREGFTITPVMMLFFTGGAASGYDSEASTVRGMSPPRGASPPRSSYLGGMSPRGPPRYLANYDSDVSTFSFAGQT